jgi:hypothetical protein
MDGKCLGKLADGRVGTLVKDDHGAQPFHVECSGVKSWYWENDIGASDAEGAAGPSGAGALGHSGEYRDVEARPPVRRPGGETISVFCVRVGVEGEGVACCHDAEMPCNRSHWSCCGVLDEGARCPKAPAAPAGAAAAGAPPAAAITVGCTVRPTAAAPSGKCLGAPADGRTGVVERIDPDGDHRVACAAMRDWDYYKAPMLELVARGAPAPTAAPAGPRGAWAPGMPAVVTCSDSDLSEADWEGCPGSHLTFLPGYDCGLISSIRGNFFDSDRFTRLWAPLKALGPAPTAAGGGGGAATAPPSSRPKVRDSVRLAPSFSGDTSKCMGAPSENKVGVISEDDHSGLPFRVCAF